jgi:pimeloyl-ACP methyl ester carboxylesterase
VADRFTHAAGRRIDVAGARLWVEEIGRADGPPVLLLPGGLGTINDFDALTPLLAPHARLIGLDSRGHGGSTLGDAPLTYARLAADVETVAETLGLDGLAILGFSDGAITGLRLAAAGWPRLARLATIGATWRLLPDDPVEAMVGGITPESYRTQFPESWRVYHAANPAPDFAGLIEQIRGLWLDRGPDGYPGETVRDIACPVLLMRGDRDPFASRSDTAALADRLAKSHLLNLPCAGHGLHDDAPALVADLLRRFLAGG